MITNEEGMVSNLSYLPPLGRSDHLSLHFNFNLTTPNNNSEYTSFNLNAGDYNFLRSQVTSINWEGMVNMTMEEAWDYFFTQFDTAIKNSIPLTSSQHKFHQNIYSNREVLRLRKKKRILWKQYTMFVGS